MQPTKSKPKSNVASDAPGKDSVYDFLYYDADRVASFLGQFDPDGHLTGIQTNARSGGSSKSTAGITASAGVPFVAGGGATGQDESGKAWHRGAEKTFNPLWGNALAFLDYLTERQLIVTDMASAGMGQIIQISGALSIVDTSILKTMIQSPVIKKMFQVEESAPSGPRQAKERARQGPTPVDTGMAIMEVLPHVIQARMATGNSVFWSSLLGTGLTVSPGDLLLKHGLHIGGTWNVVGVLDALPDDITASGPVVSDEDLGAYITALSAMVPTIRPMLGRQPHAYGITPLLIFREVSGG